MLNEAVRFSFSRDARRAKKWSVDIVVELHKFGRSDFKGVKLGPG